MSKQWKWVLAVAAAVLLTLALPLAGSAEGISGERQVPAQTASLLALRVDSGDSGPLVVRLDTDGALEYQTLVLDSPDRLVLDLNGVINKLPRYKHDVQTQGVIRVRAGQHGMEPVPQTRVVFDLESPLDYTVDRTPEGLAVSFRPSADLGDRAAVAEIDIPATTETPAPRAPLATVTEAENELDRLVHEMESRQPVDPASMRAGEDQVEASRNVEPGLIERLLVAPSLAAPGPQATYESGGTRTKIGGDAIEYGGKKISLNLVDADLKQVFRLFHEISGLNFVLDPSVTGRLTIVLDQVPWDQALDIILKNNGLDKVLDNNVIRIAATQKLAQEAAARKQLKEAEEFEVELVTVTRTLSYAKAKELEKIFRGGGAGGSSGGLLSPRGRVIVDERTNTLIVTDIPKRIQPIDALITTLDAETPQVMIEARIVETSRDFTQDLGVVWGFTAAADAAHGTATGLSFPHNVSTRYGLNLPGENTASNLAFKFGNIIDSFTLDIALNTLETQGTGRILSSPKIATQNNERAEIEQGVRIPIVNTTATEINVEFVSASLKMSVTPQITAEGTIILDVEVENNAPDFVNTAGGIPSINTQRAQTKVLISDGGTTVIGGIFTVNEGRSEQGVPWFRKLPVFGWLFKSQNITNRNRELLIFITPKIMRVA